MLRNPLYRYGNENGRVPAHLNFGKEVFDIMVKNKDQISIVNAQTGEQKTQGQVAQMTVDIALSLTRMGVKKGDVVCICSGKNFEYLPTVIGIMCAGATFSPTDPTYGGSALVHRVKIINPKIMFCSTKTFDTHKQTLDQVGSIQHYILYGDEPRKGAKLFKDFLTETAKLEQFQPVPVNGWEDLAFIAYSSGTTGLPKGIPVTHLGLLSNFQSVTTEELSGVRHFITKDFYYTYGLTYALGGLKAAAALIFDPSDDEKNMLAAIEKYKIKVLQLTPMFITELTKSATVDNYDVTTAELIVCCGTYLRAEEVRAVKERLPNLKAVLQVYGMSEGGSICNELVATKGPKPGSSGMPCHGYVIKVVDVETRQPLGPNKRGEICIRGPSVMKGYLNGVQPDCKDEEGFLKTGDIGYYDEDGYFYIVNRIKELIKFNDGSIAPAEFEALLHQHPAVREAAVVGKPDPKHGELPTAFVVLQPDQNISAKEIEDFVNNQVTHARRLAGGVIFTDRLPRGAADKLDRRGLVKKLLEEEGKGTQENGHANEVKTNGHTNGQTNSHTNGQTNGHTKTGQTNGHSNGGKKNVDTKERKKKDSCVIS